MKTPRRSLLLVLPVVSLFLASCGGPPKGDVAAIKTGSGSTIAVSDAQYHRFFLAALEQEQQKPIAQITPLVPPAFTACVTAAQKAIPADSQRKKSPVAKLKATCAAEYDKVRNTAVQQVVTLDWLKGEAADRGIKFRKAEVQLALDTTITQQFQGQAGYQTFLKQSGLNQEDVNLNIVAKLAETKIVAQVQAKQKPPTDAEVQRYFDQKKSTYVQPETRDLRLIRAKDLPDAQAALAAIKAGQSWKAVAAKYSTDTATKATGGSVVATTADQQPSEFAGTVFKAKAQALLGPIKSSLGYYVVKVQAVHPEKQPVYKDLKAQLAQALASQNQQTDLDNFKTLFFARWASRTKCASDYNQLVACGGDSGATTPTTPVNPPPGAGIPKYAAKPPVDPNAALNAAGTAASGAAASGAAQTQTQQTP